MSRERQSSESSDNSRSARRGADEQNMRSYDLFSSQVSTSLIVSTARQERPEQELTGERVQ